MILRRPLSIVLATPLESFSYRAHDVSVVGKVSLAPRCHDLTGNRDLEYAPFASVQLHGKTEFISQAPGSPGGAALISARPAICDGDPLTGLDFSRYMTGRMLGTHDQIYDASSDCVGFIFLEVVQARVL